MALINLKTDLKSLKFGNDRPGGGSSNQPYITKSIPDQDSSPSNVFNTGGPDVLLRGGLIAPIRAGLDVGRLAQMFFDFKSAAGPLFIVKQNLLSRTAVKTENTLGVGYAGGAPSPSSPLESGYFAQTQINQGVYIPTSTLAQAGVGFTGTHLNTFGLNPASPITGVVNSGGQQGGLVGYDEVIKQRNIDGEDIESKNRLVWIWDKKQAKTPTSNAGIEGDDQVNIFSYPGGPGSILGIGSTKLKFADKRTGFKNPGISTNGLGYLAQGPVYGRYEDLKNQVNPIQSGSVYPLGISNIFNTISSAGEVPTELSTDNGLTFNLLDNEGNAINNNIYNSGSLSPREDIKTYQVQQGLRVNPVINFTSPLGVSIFYNNLYANSQVPTRILLDGNNSYRPNSIPEDTNTNNSFTTNLTELGSNNVYEEGTLNPRSDLQTYNNSNQSNFINYNTTFVSGASKEYVFYSGTGSLSNVTEEFNGITDQGQRLFSNNIYTSPLSPISESKSYLASWGGGGINSTTSPYSNTIDYRQLLGVSNIFADVTNDFPELFNENNNNINESDGQKFDTFNYNVYQIVPNPNGGSSTNFKPTILSTLNGTKTYTQNDIYQNSIDLSSTSLISRYGGFPGDFRRPILASPPPFGLELTPNSEGGYGDGGLKVKDDKKVGYGTKSSPPEVTSKVLSISPNYKTRGGRTRVGLGDPGRYNTVNGTKHIINYGLNAQKQDSLLDAVDKINAQKMYTSTGPNGSLAINDYAKFRIAAISNDSVNGKATYMHFRAFIDSFNDSYTATWNPVQYAGRGDNFYNYSGFGRTISMGFTVYAQSKAELTPMYRKLNYLASTLAPDYNSAGFMRGNLIRLTLGSYLHEVPGFITSLTYEIPQECTWEIAIDENGAGDSSVKELPHCIKVTSLSFTPVHQFLVEKPNNPILPNTRYISLSTQFYGAGLYKQKQRKYTAAANATIPGEAEGSADNFDLAAAEAAAQSNNSGN